DGDRLRRRARVDGVVAGQHERPGVPGRPVVEAAVLAGVAEDDERSRGPAASGYRDDVVAGAALDQRDAGVDGRGDVEVVVPGAEHDVDHFDAAVRDAAVEAAQVRGRRRAEIQLEIPAHAQSVEVAELVHVDRRAFVDGRQAAGIHGVAQAADV